MGYSFQLAAKDLLYAVRCNSMVRVLSFQPVLYDWFNKDHGMCYPIYGMVYIKDPLLLIGKSSPCSGGSRFPLSLFE